jgi:serine/threonine protein kinase
MIAFACSQCGVKLNVKPEFAGRRAACPTCKQPLVVPAADQTQAYVATGQIEGTPSSLMQVGVEGGITLEQTDAGSQQSVRELMARQTRKDGRYLIDSELARGGMGAVLRAVDCDIRREVAVKYMLDQGDPKKTLRFIEEAQITGQLEHPNIVPIHELGVDAHKRLFFSMKMVKGRSLAQVLHELRQQPRAAEKTYPLSRLLNVLVNVCHALSYAHSRGVVHRDLKPANVMLGDFGEVYVMDWGLAKVLKGESQSVTAVSHQLSTAKRSSKVVTGRQPEADLTQEGSVVGTPVYMPPEQATGKIGDIDPRSDVYSLGAILYEVLTLQAPVDKEGGYLAVLMRVAEGQIVPPEQRNVQRARGGKIPLELSAMAMKALAKDPEDRYASVEALRRDIERFQEGRSVSAKEDSRREMIWKFVKRNKGFSVGAAAALLVLLCSTVFLFKAWLETRQAKAASERAQQEMVRAHQEKEKRTQQAVPALMVAAREVANNGDFRSALGQITVVQDYDPANADAHLLRGHILIAQKQFAAARDEVAEYLRWKPGDADARKLLHLCDRGKPDNPETLLAIAELLQRQRAFGPAVPLLAELERAVKDREPLLPLYQKQVDAAWPGLGKRLELTRTGQFKLNFYGCKQITSLERLRGLPLGVLSLRDCDIQDLTPLQGMPLTWLELAGCSQVRDLSPLKGMPLSELDLMFCPEISDLKPLQGMPLTSLKIHRAKVRDLSPLQGMPLTTLELGACMQVRDLTPLKGMPLTTLMLGECFLIGDLTPLQGMPLTSLKIGRCREVRDLTPLRGMPLRTLEIHNCEQVHDLTPLHGMPLLSLDMPYCPLVQDLSPLEGMRLEEIFFTPKDIRKGLPVLRQMKSLKTIGIRGWAKDRLPPEEFWKKYDAGEFK